MFTTLPFFLLLLLYQIIVEGIPIERSDLRRQFRGYIAVDELKFSPAEQCDGFCNFEGGFCEWTQDSNDDFDWIQVSV